MPECRIAVKVRKTIFHNEDTGYTVLSVSSKREEFCATCFLPVAIHDQQEIELTGDWTMHPKYGKQFKARSVTHRDPATADGIRSYLCSHVVHGIGPAIAHRIVDEFGDKTLDVLDQDPYALLQVKGIGKKSIDRIIDSWQMKRTGARIVAELCNIGLSVVNATKVYKTYENDVFLVLRENPYKLAEDVQGIGFKKADEIAESAGFGKTHPFRIRAGILYVLKQSMDQGHSFLPEQILRDRSTELLAADMELIAGTIGAMEWDGKLKAVYNERLRCKVFYLPSLYDAEKFIRRKVEYLASMPLREIAKGVPRNICGHELTDEQYTAAHTAVTNPLSIIIGSAGTGKTTTLQAIIDCIENNGLTYRLCAPTGKAAKRIHEVTGREAATIHRLLAYGPSWTCAVNEQNPLTDDFVIIDEASMIDLFLMNALLKGVTDRTSIVLIGDPFNQLPPVGVGNVVRDIANSEICPVTRLKKIHRQKETSSVIDIANSIVDGVVPVIPNRGDAYFFEIESPDDVVEKITRLSLHYIPKKFGIPFHEIQILTPMRRGTLGTENLNAVIQKTIHPKGTPGLKQFFVKDRVMQIANNYDKGIFNGEIGYVESIDEHDQYLSVRFDSRTIEYAYTELDQLMLSYSITVHRCIGSQSQCVIAVFHGHQQSCRMLRRDILYTAVTRTRDLLIIIGTRKALEMAVKNGETQQRFSGLFDHS